MSVRSRYRKMQELYVDGAELEFTDGTVMWLQIMNPWELEEARRDAQVARSRYVMTMKEIGSDEYLRLHATFVSRGRDGIIDDLLEADYSGHFLKASQAIEVDEDWREKFIVLQRSEEIEQRPEEDPERQLLEKINAEWLEEILKRVKDEQDLEREELASLDDDALFKRYESEWVERRATAAAMIEYAAAELAFACRACEAQKTEFGWSHDSCDHSSRVYENKQEILALPEKLTTMLRARLEEVVLTAREAKNSPRLLSSSESSQQPSSAGESTVSTPIETQEPHPSLL